MKQHTKTMIEALRNFPANGQLHDGEQRHLLLAHGLIERMETKIACKTCGTPRRDHTWYKITPAGRLLLEVAPDDAPTQP